MRRISCSIVALLALSAPLVRAGEEAEKVPVTDVVLFSSGVGYFGRSGKVAGDTQLELTFKAEQINDLLKSLVVLDLDKGQVSGVSYASHDPTGRSLKAFGIDLTGDPSAASILRQLRGVKVAMGLPGEEVTGTVLGVEVHTRKTENGDIISVELVNVLAETGRVRSVELSSVQGFNIADKTLAEDLKKALSVLAKSRDRKKRAVTISFSGKGTRRVKVAYILEAPVWKTSYRLLLGDAAFLQGWAIVENTTDSDWKKVNLSLVSGRPISFIQDLYSPLYLQRPVVRPKLYAGLRPREYDEAMDFGGEQAERLAAAPAPSKPMSRARRAEAAKSGFYRGADKKARESLRKADALADVDGATLGALAKSTMVAGASGGEAGELFRYAVKTPVTIGRQSSAMLPVIAGEVTGEKLSIYNRSAHPKHPFSGFKLKNATKLALLAGPVTVFDDGVYAGDSQIGNLQPGEERLLSYGLDLTCTVEHKSEGKPSQLVSAKIVNGTIQSQYKYFQETAYTVKSKKDERKTVLVEHPYQYGWKLVAPKKFDERTESVYRFKVPLKAKETKKLLVASERVQMQTYYLTNINSSFIGVYVRSRVISEKVKAALRRVVAMKAEISAVSRKRRDLESAKRDLYNEQSRLRSNLKSVPSKSKLYARYLGKLGTQEDAIEKVMVAIENAREEEQQKQKELNDYVRRLSVE